LDASRVGRRAALESGGLVSLWRQLTRGLRVLTNRTDADRDVTDEVELFLEQATAALEATGLSPAEARRTARRQLGNVTTIRDEAGENGFGGAACSAGLKPRPPRNRGDLEPGGRGFSPGTRSEDFSPLFESSWCSDYSSRCSESTIRT
jgi:hypothetical protein